LSKEKQKKKQKTDGQNKGSIFIFFQRKESFGICGNQSYFFRVRKKEKAEQTHRKCNKSMTFFRNLHNPNYYSLPLVEICTKSGVSILP